MATEGAGNAGNIALNVSNFTLGSGSQIASSTMGEWRRRDAGSDGERAGFHFRCRQWFVEHGIEHGECGTDYRFCARLDGCADADAGRWSKDFGCDIGIR